MVVNEAIERQGLLASQTLATLFDGITRHNPEGLWFRRHARVHGFKATVAWRDSGEPIPEGDAARAAIAELDAIIAESEPDRGAR
jgi:enoyl-CoA hydratase